MIYTYILGRLGNNLAQIAAAATLADKFKQDFIAVPHPTMVLPAPDNCSVSEYIKPYLNTIFRNVRFVDSVPDNIPIISESTDLTKLVIAENEDICLLLNGTIYDFNFYNRKSLQKVFAIDAETEQYIKNKYPQIFDGGRWCSVHVRRGDYLDIPQDFAICSKHYFEKAMAQMNDDYYLIVSDDLDWCRKNFVSKNIVIADKESALVHMYLQVFCSDNITSNSTFSLWAAIINDTKDQKVCVPSPWFGFAHRKLEVHQQRIIPVEWRRISNYSWRYIWGMMIWLKNGIKLNLQKLKR